MGRTAEKLARWLRSRLDAAGARGFVVGLSGGVDSAVVARLCQTAAPERTLCVVLPCLSAPEDAADAIRVAEHFHLSVVTITLDEAYDALAAAAGAALQDAVAGTAGGEEFLDTRRVQLALANLKPRLRMTTLYFVANRLNSLVVGTGNRSELAIGYFTKYGDGGVDLLPLGGLLKSEVRALARELGVPPAIIDKPPSAGLWLGQTDEGEMGFTYADLEAYLREGPHGVAPAVAVKIERLARASEHKRALPPIPEDV